MKKSINHILVPTDFSGFSNRAFHFACEIAGRTGAKILLFHVVEPPYNFATAVKGMMEMMEKNALKRMKLLEEEADADVEITHDIRHGRTTREIINCVDREGIDMVVMGSRGQSALSRAVLGSVSEIIAKDLSVPLFLIPYHEESENLDIDIDTDIDFSTLVFATDLKPDDVAHLEYSKMFATLFDATVLPAHFSPSSNFDERIRLAGFIQVLREETGDKTIDVEKITGDNFMKSLLEFVTQKDASAIIINRYSKNVLQKLLQKDHTDDMVLHSDVPLLILPPDRS